MDADNALLTLKGRNRLPSVQIVSLLEQAAAMRSALAVMERAGTEVTQCVEALEKASDVLGCPVYGKVVYDGKKCLPCSF